MMKKLLQMLRRTEVVPFELESVQNCVEGAQKMMAQMRTCNIRE